MQITSRDTAYFVITEPVSGNFADRHPVTLLLHPGKNLLDEARERQNSGVLFYFGVFELRREKRQPHSKVEYVTHVIHHQWRRYRLRVIMVMFSFLCVCVYNN